MIIYRHTDYATTPLVYYKPLMVFDDIEVYEVDNEDFIDDSYTVLPEKYKDVKFDSNTFNNLIGLFKGYKKDYGEDGKKFQRELTDQEKEDARNLYICIKELKLRRYYEIVMNRYIGKIRHEQFSWDIQRTEAEKVLANPDNIKDTDVPFIATIAKKRGLTLKEIAERIDKKAKEYSQFASNMLGELFRYEDLVEAAKSVEDIIEINKTLPDYCIFSFEKDVMEWYKAKQEEQNENNNNNDSNNNK